MRIDESSATGQTQGSRLKKSDKVSKFSDMAHLFQINCIILIFKIAGGKFV